jgi:hypothetical protein
MKGSNEDEFDRPALVVEKVVRIAAYTVAGVVFGGLVAYALVMVGLFLASR